MHTLLVMVGGGLHSNLQASYKMCLDLAGFTTDNQMVSQISGGMTYMYTEQHMGPWQHVSNIPRLVHI